ncbi:flavin reductase [Feifania hominis]|uniref:Flavin reductase n=1 Tax=Feifania hominis TaxID=2763660 RepID=A0A926DCG9_9FIRM|nr:flavin reductase [Feifania hominis]MBC8535284.1 flavin reductase [Feifania hominis]
MDIQTFFKMTYGLYVVGSVHEGRVNAQIADAIMQISNDPVTIAVSLNRENLTNEFVKKSKKISVNILPEDLDMSVVNHFGMQSGRAVDKFATVDYETGVTGAPILKDNSLGYFEGEVIDVIDVYTHTIFVVRPVEAKLFSDKAPISYNEYRERKARAIREQKATGGRYKCAICGYIYDEQAEGKKFDELPEDYECPVCHAPKRVFEKI